MLDIEEFYPMIRPEVADCPDMAIRSALLSALIEFTQESLLWHEGMTPITTVEGTQSYTVAPPAGSRLLLAYQLTLDSSAISPTFTAVDTFTLGASPLDGQTIEGRIALAPARTATQVPDILYDQYAECLASGALLRLLAQPGRAWSNPKLVSYHREIFEAGYLHAKVMTMKGFSGQDQLSNANPTTYGVSA